jgi:hypothetical protein
MIRQFSGSKGMLLMTALTPIRVEIDSPKPVGLVRTSRTMIGAAADTSLFPWIGLHDHPIMISGP